MVRRGRWAVTSLRARLLVVWVASLGACAVIGVLFVQLYAQSSNALAASAESAGLRACDRLADRFSFYATGWDPGPTAPLDVATRRDLLAVAQAAASFGGMSLGFWHEAEHVVAATPLSPPANEMAALDEAATETLSTDAPAQRIAGAAPGALLVACPLRGPLRSLTGWVRVAMPDAAGLDTLRLGVGVLLALVAGISAWLTWLITSWNFRVSQVESALATASPHFPRTGLRELDRLVEALERANLRLIAARERAAVNERLAALGRVAAGVAHEIRNPVAAMRLGAENALAGPPAAHGAVLEATIRQIDRVDRLIAELLEMTDRKPPRPEPVNLPAFLNGHIEASGLPAKLRCDVEDVHFDPALVGRVLAILLDNARRHAPGAAVSLSAVREADTLRLTVADDGPGVSETVRANLFEPFVTSAPNGTGLGLAIARELTKTSSGTLELAPGPGATFILTLPWQQS